MAKPNFKDILLAKGDKIALGIGGAAVGLLGLWGIASLATAESPSGKAKEFESKATALKSQVSSKGSDAPELPSWVTKSIDKTKIDPAAFALAGSPFEPVDRPDTLRKNPTVLAIDAYQYEIVRLPMRALDIQRTSSNDVVVGVKATAKATETDPAKIRENTDAAKKKFLGKAPPVRRPGTPTGLGGAFPPGGGGVPGGGGFPGGAPGGGGFPGGGAPGGGGFPGGGGGAPGRGGIPGQGDSGGDGSTYGGGQRADQTVIYVPFSEVEKRGLPLAETIYPLRAVLITATFPIKQQLEEVKRALRAQSDAEAAFLAGSNGVPGPSFDGFDVDRRILPPGGTWSDWGVLDHFTRYFQDIAVRKIPGVPDTPDSDYVNYFLRPADEKMFAPLPPLADRLGEYGKLRLPSILEGVRKLKELNKPVVTPTDWERRFGSAPGSSNPYAPTSGGAGVSGTGGFPPGGAFPPGGGGPGGGLSLGGDSAGGRPPGAFPPGGGFPPSGGFPPGGYPPGTGATPGTAQPNPYEINTHTLLRFFDSDVQPGYSYQYRIRVRMKNPNFKMADKVSKPDDAKIEFLEGRWQDMPDVVSIPVDSFLYAGNSATYVAEKTDLIKEYGNETQLRKLLETDEVAAGRRAVVQLHRWMPQVRIEGSGNKVEPVGTWVVAEVPVGPGEFIGKRQLIELPLWSGGLGNYVLRELSGGVKVAGIRESKHQPKGWPVNFRQSSILVDFEGGKSKLTVNGREVLDEADSELLILQPDGKVSVRNSGEDGKLTDRAERQIIWTDWIKRVKERRDVAVPGGIPGAPGGGFDRGGN